MKRMLAIAAVIACLSPAIALALPVVDVGFDPTEVCPGNQVQFFFSLENQGDVQSDVTLSVSFDINGYQFGPFEGVIPMAAGQVISHEIPFYVPQFVPAGYLTVSVTATDATGSTSDSGTLTVLECGPKAAMPSITGLAKNFQMALRQIGVH